MLSVVEGVAFSLCRREDSHSAAKHSEEQCQRRGDLLKNSAILGTKLVWQLTYITSSLSSYAKSYSLPSLELY